MSNTDKLIGRTLTAAQLKAARTKVKARGEKEDKKALDIIRGARSDAPRRQMQTPEMGLLSHAMEQFIRTGTSTHWAMVLQATRKDSLPGLWKAHLPWRWEDRHKVILARPDIPRDTLSAKEVLAQLANQGALAMPLIQAGYKMDPTYVEQYVDPQSWIFPLLIATVDQTWPVKPVWASSVMKAAEVLFVPPLPTNMLANIRVEGSRTYKTIPVEVIAKANKIKFDVVSVRDKLQLPRAPPKPSKDAGKEAATAWRNEINERLYNWTVHMSPVDGDGRAPEDAPTVYKPTSPGLPYIAMHPPTGATSWGKKDSPHVVNRSVKIHGEFMDWALKELTVNWVAWKDLPMTDLLQKAVDVGRQMYIKVWGLNRVSMVDRHKANCPEGIWADCLWSVGAGNVKPVTSDEVKEGSPKRAIYAASQFLDMISAKTAAAWYQAARHPAIRQGFSWAHGGAEAFITELVGSSTIQFDELPVEGYSGDHIQGVSIQDAVTIVPDAAKMDLNLQEEYQDKVAQQEVMLLTESNLAAKGTDRLLPALAAVQLGFSLQANKQPLVMWGAGIVYKPRHLNPSGGRRTFNLNTTKSVCVIEVFREGVKLSGKEYAPPVIMVENKRTEYRVPTVGAWGDDVIMRLDVQPQRDNNPDGGRLVGFGRALPGGLDGNAESRRFKGQMVKAFDDALLGQWEKRETVGGGLMPARPWESGATLKKKGWMQKVAELTGTNWKQSTLQLHERLSDASLLSMHMFATTEGMEADGAPAFVAARPFHKILHSMMWPHHKAFAPVTPQIHAALRAVAAFMEGAAAYPPLRVLAVTQYKKAVTMAGSVSWDDPLVARALAGMLSHLHLEEDEDPVKVLHEAGISLGRFPALQDVWELATGLDAPESLSEEEKPAQVSEEDADIAAFLDDSDEAGETEEAKEPEGAQDTGASPDVDLF